MTLARTPRRAIPFRKMNAMRWCLLITVLAVGCSKPLEAPQLVPPNTPSGTQLSTASTANPMPDRHAVKTLDEAAPLEEGVVAFEGMVRPSKGGYDVRGVTLDDTALRRWMAQALDGLPRDPEWFLGARVKVTAELREHEGTSPKGGLAVQTREGRFFSVSRLDSVELVKNAETIEGTLAPSKGFFALSGHLVTRDDLGWSLSPTGAQAGDRVRLRGQSRVVKCPTPQCLLGGSLPLFDVARAERLP